MAKHSRLHLFLWVLFFVGVCSTPTLAQQRECNKSFRIQGVDKDGKSQDFVITFKRFLVDFDQSVIDVKELEEERKYRGYYTLKPNLHPTRLTNCPGYVANYLWGTGNTTSSVSEIHTRIINVFLQREFSSGSVQKGDIVIFGPDTHIAVVTGPGTTNRFPIESKDNEGAPLEGVMDTSRFNDPIIVRNGSPRFYRLLPFTVTEVAPGNCDAGADLKIIIEVNESAYGKLRPVGQASVTLQFSSGAKVGPTLSNDSNGEAEFLISKATPEQLLAARQGVRVEVTKKGYHSKSDSISADLLSGTERRWMMTLTRTADNPIEADPNIPPPPVSPTGLSDWQKKLTALIAKIAALEARRPGALAKLNTGRASIAKIAQAREKIKELLEKLRDQSLKDAIARAEQHCKDATAAVKSLAEQEKKIREKEKAATALTDEILKLAEACASADDVKTIRAKTQELTQTIKDMEAPLKQAKADNDTLKTLMAKLALEMKTLATAADLRKEIGEQNDAANKAFAEAFKAFDEARDLTTGISNTKSALTTELFDLRQQYPFLPMPDATEKQLEALDGRLTKVTEGLSNAQDIKDLQARLDEVDKLVKEADQVVSEYQKKLCTIQARDNAIERIEGSVTFAALGLHTVTRAEAQVQKCELKLYCQEQAAKVEQALSVGDIDTSAPLIGEMKAKGCDTSELEQKAQKVQDKVFDLLTAAKNAWRDAATYCDYEAAYKAAQALAQQFPNHPWIIQNLPEIERAGKAQQEIKQITEQLVAADRNSNYAEAERLIAQAEKVAAPYPCLVTEVAKLRKEYLKGKPKPGSTATEQECLTLLAEIRQALDSDNLVVAAQKLKIAQQRCANVTPAIFAALQALQQQLEQAIQQLSNKTQTKMGQCEFEAALQLAEQLQQLNPAAPWLAANLTNLQQQAAAQREAREYLRAGKAAIEGKNLDGAISALASGLAVPNLPTCMRSPMETLKKELTIRKEFINLTEQVEEATRLCDYTKAQQVVGKITAISPRYDFVTTWMNTELPKLSELIQHRQQALQFIKDADSLANQAVTAAATEPVDWTKVGQLVQQAMGKLDEADSIAPKCMQERNQMEAIRQKCRDISQKKPAEIQTSIVLLIDTSGSMGDNNKIENAKAAARAAVQNVSKTNEIAVLGFSGDCSGGAVRYACPFTTDLNALLKAIDGLGPGGGTPMYIATGVAVDYAKKKARGKSATVVLMSDGGDTCRDKQAEASAAIRQSNIPVNTIGYDVGNNQQAQGDLANLATLTGGRSYSASTADPKEIVNAFKLAMLPSLFKDFELAQGGSGSAVSGHFAAAKRAIQQQDLNAATYQLQQAQSLAPNSAAVNYNLALVNEANDKPLAAIRNAESYLKLAPNALDRADVEGRIAQMRRDVEANPRAEYDPNACRDIYNWAMTEREAAKKSGNPSRLQTLLEIQIAAQRGDCAKARQLQASYRQQFR